MEAREIDGREINILDFDELVIGMYLFTEAPGEINVDSTGCVVTKIDVLNKTFEVREDRCHNLYSFEEKDLYNFNFPLSSYNLTEDQNKYYGEVFLFVNWCLFYDV